MPDQIQLRGGTAADNDGFTGVNREVTVDTTNKTLRVHDGVTSGGSKLAAFDEWGRLQVADPVDDSDVVNKSFMDTAIAMQGALVIKDTAQSIPDSTATEVSWQATVYNTSDGVIDLANNRFVIPAGWEYARLAARADFSSNATGRRDIEIQKNGAGFPGQMQLRSNATNAADRIGGETAIIPVSEGDLFTVVVVQNSGGAIDLQGGNNTWFSIEKVVA